MDVSPLSDRSNESLQNMEQLQVSRFLTVLSVSA